LFRKVKIEGQLAFVHLHVGQGAEKLEFGVVMRRPDVHDTGTLTPAFVLNLDRGRTAFAFYFSDVSWHTSIVYRNAVSNHPLVHTFLP
jgi:hypothetical protein